MPTVRIAIARPTAYAWIEGGPHVLIRTRHGLAQELLPTYARDAAYPCYSTGIAASATGELVVSGRCRAHSGEWDTSTPHEGFIAERGPSRWSIRRGFAPLRAIASDGRRFIAVGDRGIVLVRDGSGWHTRRHGTTEFTAIIDPPRSGILAVGAAAPRPMVVDGELVAATVMTVTVSADHRVLDGAVAARWLAAFTTLMERPLRLLL